MDRNWNSIMFDNIGVKIQKVAKIITWVNIVISIIGGIALFFCGILIDEMLWLILLAPIEVLLGCVMAWLSTIILYGFGKLIEDVEAIRNKKPPIIKVDTEPTYQSVPKATQSVTKKEENTATHTSPETTFGNISEPTKSGSTKKDSKPPEVPLNILPCPHCGEDLSFMGWDDVDLKQKQTCPLCGKEFLINQ